MDHFADNFILILWVKMCEQERVKRRLICAASDLFNVVMQFRLDGCLTTGEIIGTLGAGYDKA